ncbi:hypothetical protein D1007_05198 [Hordeum vulgare]|nr:hypothetical protein D1007_05198 [Hordeum vulgare]
MMLTPEHRRLIEEEIRARRAARIAVGLPLDLPEPDEEWQPEEEGEQLPEPMKVADPVDEPEQPALGFNMTETEFVVDQAKPRRWRSSSSSSRNKWSPTCFSPN